MGTGIIRKEEYQVSKIRKMCEGNRSITICGRNSPYKEGCNRVGVTTWIRSACTTHAGYNSRLRLLFNELTHLSSTLTNAVFVLDSPGLLADIPQSIIDFFMGMVENFGFHTHTVSTPVLSILSFHTHYLYTCRHLKKPKRSSLL